MSLNERSAGSLHVVGGSHLVAPPCGIEVDEYVPLRWRTYDEPLGVGHVRLGNYSTTLIELAVEPRMQVIRGVTITSVDLLSPWPRFSISGSSDELPVISTSFEGGEIVDMEDDFEVSVRPGEIVVFWGDLSSCRAYACGGTHFLACDGVLVGIWFMGLSDEETTSFVSHARSRQ